MVKLLYTLAFVWIVMLFSGGCASSLDGDAWLDLTEVEVLRASDGYVRAVVGENVFDMGFVRDGGWAERSDAYLYSYRFSFGYPGQHTATVKTEVSQYGDVQLRSAYSSRGRFDFGAAGLAGYFRIGPKVALKKAIRSGFGDPVGHWQVVVGYDDSDGILVWRVQQFVKAGRSSYFETIDIDPRSGSIVNHFQNYLGWTTTSNNLRR